MDTPDNGTVTVASVTLTGDTPGTTNLDLTVAAIGDESRNSYSISAQRNGELIVEGEDTPTLTETPTETDTTNSDIDDSSDCSSSSDEDASNSDENSDATPTPSETPTATPTPVPTEMATEQTTITGTNSTNSTATSAGMSTPTQPSSGDSVEREGLSDNLVIVSGGILVLFGGIVIYRRL